MKVLKYPNSNDSFLFHSRDEVIKMNFLLRKIAYFRNESPFFDIIFLGDWVEIEDQEISNVTIINRAKLLVKHLKIEIGNDVEVYINLDDPSCFLLKKNGKFIQVDTKFNSLSDESDSLFLRNTYNLGKPETENRTLINTYNEILKNLDECINSLLVHKILSH